MDLQTLARYVPNTAWGSSAGETVFAAGVLGVTGVTGTNRRKTSSRVSMCRLSLMSLSLCVFLPLFPLEVLGVVVSDVSAG
jgi:hypothetical protein